MLKSDGIKKPSCKVLTKICQETEPPNKVTQEPQETSQSAAPQLEVNVYTNYIPLCDVLIGIVGIGIYMSLVIIWVNNLKETLN